MKKLWIVALGLCVLALATPAQAGKKNKGGSTAGPDVFARYDTNGNGVLDDSEKEAIKKAFATDPDLKKYDTDGDGKLSDNELAAIQPSAPAKKKKKH